MNKIGNACFYRYSSSTVSGVCCIILYETYARYVQLASHAWFTTRFILVQYSQDRAGAEIPATWDQDYVVADIVPVRNYDRHEWDHDHGRYANPTRTGLGFLSKRRIGMEHQP